MPGVHKGQRHQVNRHTLFDDIVDLYRKNPRTLMEYPFTIRFSNELAVDLGGVTRDMFSAFWEHAYTAAFDGCSTLIPQTHPHINKSLYPVLGTIMSHGFLIAGILPIRLSFTTVIATLFGPVVSLPDNIYIESLMDYISPLEVETLRAAFKVMTPQFGQQLTNDLISLLSRFGCRKVPNHDNLRNLVVDVAKHEFIAKPLAPLYALQSGIPVPHLEFWRQFTLDDLYALFKELRANAAKVLQRIEVPDDMNCAQENVVGYLRRMIGGMRVTELSNFLRFVTGSCVRMDEAIIISFNSLSGLARRPLAHTCGCRLELPVTYLTYMEFEREFKALLDSEYAWIMDAV